MQKIHEKFTELPTIVNNALKNDVFHWDLANDNKDPLLWKSKGNAKNATDSIPALLAEVWGISEICQ